MPLPELPLLRQIHGLGMSDPPALASHLEAKFTYTNTFYHQEPKFDVTHPGDAGRYDFIVSSEVMEHVPPPVEAAFANLCQMLKSDGFLLLTVPYRLEGPPEEHFPQLHHYSLASVGGRTVLLNRTVDGVLQVFENLCFHGGHGSTLEMRVFSEPSLKKMLYDAGFCDVRIAADDLPEFGVWHPETWSLPIVARKGPRATLDLAPAYRELSAKLAATSAEASAAAEGFRIAREEVRLAGAELDRLRAELAATVQRAQALQSGHQDEMAERLDWVNRLEHEHAERTEWARSLERDNVKQLEWASSLQTDLIERADAIAHLEAEKARVQSRLDAAEYALREVQSARAAVDARLWTRVGRKLKLG